MDRSEASNMRLAVAEVDVQRAARPGGHCLVHVQVQVLALLENTKYRCPKQAESNQHLPNRNIPAHIDP